MKYIKFIIASMILFISSISFAQITDAYIQQKVSQLQQQNGYLVVDSYIDYVSINEMEIMDSFSISLSFFDVFDYTTQYDLITIDSIRNYTIIKEENNKLTLKDGDIETEISNINITFTYNGYGIDILGSYPQFFLNGDKLEVTNYSSSGEYKYYYAQVSKDIGFGTYQYYVLANNATYNKYISQPYRSEYKEIVITARPKNFANNNKNVENSKKYYSSNVDFSWSCDAGVLGDNLSCDFYIGTSEESMEKLSNELVTIDKSVSGTRNNFGFNLDNKIYYLFPGTQYFWKVEIQNQYGVKMVSPIYNFFTTGEKVTKLFNAPNPFNPMKEKTKLYFNMPAPGSAEIIVYSEYGDKIFSTNLRNLAAGTNYYNYDGKDDRSNTLYNGTYLCVIKKKYNNTTSTERCRLLIIK